jgi:hypothetical protein
MKLTEEIARDLRCGTVFSVSGERIGIRKVRRVWFNPVTAHYVADVGGVFLWTDTPSKPWPLCPLRSGALREDHDEASDLRKTATGRWLLDVPIMRHRLAARLELSRLVAAKLHRKRATAGK